MHQIIIIAKKECADAIRNKIFLTFLFFLLFLTAVSVVIGSLDFQSKVIVYNQALAQLRQSGQVIEQLSQPGFYPLQLLRGSIEYLEIIGAVLAIVLGYLTIAKEKGNNTLQLILSRPITRIQFFFGKILGNVFLLTTVVGSIFLLILLMTTVIGGVPLSQLELLKVFLSFLFSSMYLFIFFCFSATLSLLFRSLPSALIFAFVIWLLFVLIVPQIGDTMDPDNQIPGGLFARLHMEKPQQLIVLKHFTFYETSRNALEEASITKHYERLVFALLGIKEMYNNQSLAFIFTDKLGDSLWILSFTVISLSTSVLVFTRKEVLWKQDE